MPPGKYLGVPWPAWGETDVALTGALHWLDAMTCGCGCGQYKDEAWSDENADDWVVDDTMVCHAGAALEQWRKESGENAPPGTLVTVRREAAEQSISQQEDPAERRARQAAKRAQAQAELKRQQG